MQKYHFFKKVAEQLWWCYERGFYTVRRSEAAIFTEEDWSEWAKYEGLEREEARDLVTAVKVNAPTLPGLEI